jgi:hypothetical protein
MAKKNFLDNPALKFISLPQEQDTAAAEPEPIQEPERAQEQKPQTRLDELRTVVPEGYKLEKITEKRTKRIQLVIEPSLYDKLRSAAARSGVSVNEYAIQALNEKIKGEN